MSLNPQDITGTKETGFEKITHSRGKELLHKPDRKVLDRLSLLAGFQDWDSFQDALHGDASADGNYK